MKKRERSSRSNRSVVLGLFFTGLLLLIGVDAAVKYWAHTSLPLIGSAGRYYPYGGIGLIQNWHGIEFSLTYATNKGAIWGSFAHHPILLLIARLTIITALLIACFRSTSWHRRIAFVLVLAGALGNILDFFTYGHVVDLFYFRFWGWSYPIFNVADAFIFCGITWLILSSLFLGSKKKQKIHRETPHGDS